MSKAPTYFDVDEEAAIEAEQLEYIDMIQSRIDEEEEIRAAEEERNGVTVTRVPARREPFMDAFQIDKKDILDSVLSIFLNFENLTNIKPYLFLIENLAFEQLSKLFGTTEKIKLDGEMITGLYKNMNQIKEIYIKLKEDMKNVFDEL